MRKMKEHFYDVRKLISVKKIFLPLTKIIRRGKLILRTLIFRKNLFVCGLILTDFEFSGIVLSKLIHTNFSVGYI